MGQQRFPLGILAALGLVGCAILNFAAPTIEGWVRFFEGERPADSMIAPVLSGDQIMQATTDRVAINYSNTMLRLIMINECIALQISGDGNGAEEVARLLDAEVQRVYLEGGQYGLETYLRAREDEAGKYGCSPRAGVEK